MRVNVSILAPKAGFFHSLLIVLKLTPVSLASLVIVYPLVSAISLTLFLTTLLSPTDLHEHSRFIYLTVLQTIYYHVLCTNYLIVYLTQAK